MPLARLRVLQIGIAAAVMFAVMAFAVRSAAWLYDRRPVVQDFGVERVTFDESSGLMCLSGFIEKRNCELKQPPKTWVNLYQLSPSGKRRWHSYTWPETGPKSRPAGGSYFEDWCFSVTEQQLHETYSWIATHECPLGGDVSYEFFRFKPADLLQQKAD